MKNGNCYNPFKANNIQKRISYCIYLHNHCHNSRHHHHHHFNHYSCCIPLPSSELSEVQLSGWVSPGKECYDDIAWHFNNLSRSHLQSQVTFAQVVKMPVLLRTTRTLTWMIVCHLRTVPTIVIAHTFCASPDTQISYRRCLLIQEYFCAV